MHRPATIILAGLVVLIAGAALLGWSLWAARVNTWAFIISPELVHFWEVALIGGAALMLLGGSGAAFGLWRRTQANSH